MLSKSRTRGQARLVMNACVPIDAFFNQLQLAGISIRNRDKTADKCSGVGDKNGGWYSITGGQRQKERRVLLRTLLHIL